MLNNDFKISENLDGSAFISWVTANADDVSWLFVNGYLSQGPIFTGAVDRQIKIRFSRDLNKAIEIHDFETLGIQPNSIVIKEFDKPFIEWDADAEATKYLIYHTPFGEPEVLLTTVPVEDSRQRYVLRSPVRLVEGWHYFRVESVSQFGIESTREIWRYRAFRIPTPVNGLTIANGSGANLFDIVIN